MNTHIQTMPQPNFHALGTYRTHWKKSKQKKMTKKCRFGTLFRSYFILTPLELETQYSRYIVFKGFMRVDIHDFLISCFVFYSQASKVCGFLKNAKTRKTAIFIHVKINNKKTKPKFKKLWISALIYIFAILKTPESSFYNE